MALLAPVAFRKLARLSKTRLAACARSESENQKDEQRCDDWIPPRRPGRELGGDSGSNR